MPPVQRISPFLWFDDQAEPAARFYTGVFPDSRIVHVNRYTDAGQEVHGHEPGSVMVVDFELSGQPFSALNGGPQFHFTEAVSFVVRCENQEEIDHYWNRLSEVGDPDARQCGWLKDRYGLSWQVVPTALPDLLGDSDRQRAGRVMQALMGMTRIDIAALEAARD